jgi:hypothetical protein
VRRALAAGLLSCALAAHAQPSPEPVSPANTQPAGAPASETQSAQNPPAPDTSLAAPAVEPPPRPPKASAPRPAPAQPPSAAESAHEAEVATLRAEVNRLQSELDAERAAAVPPPPEETAAAAPARSPWGWLGVTALLALAAGFLLGWRLLDRRIRRKYGGLRIY